MNTLLIQNNFEETSDNIVTERYTKTLNDENLSILVIQKESPDDDAFIAILFDDKYDEIADFFTQDENLDVCIDKALKLLPDFLSKEAV